MKTKKLTDVKVKNLRPQESRYEVFQGDGFGVRVGTSGKKSWVMFYRNPEGRLRRFTIGRYPAMSLADARAAFEVHRQRLAKGIDPAAERDSRRRALDDAPPVDALADEYIQKHARPKKKSWKADERLLERFVRPEWGSMKAQDVSKRMVIDLLDRIAESTPTTANRVLALIRKLFNFGLERDLIAASPCAQVKAPAAEKRRDRILSEDEIKDLWRGLENTRPEGKLQGEGYSPLSEATALALKLQLLTAQRIGEIVGMTWDEVDTKSGWWTIGAERSKNGLPHRVPITDLAEMCLKRAKTLSGGSPFVFPNRSGNGPIAYGVADYALRRTREHLELDHFTPHDLRRTAASFMTGNGVPRLVVQKILNHAERGVTAVYDRHSYDEEKRLALQGWAILLSGMASQAKDHLKKGKKSRVG